MTILTVESTRNAALVLQLDAAILALPTKPAD